MKANNDFEPYAENPPARGKYGVDWGKRVATIREKNRLPGRGGQWFVISEWVHKGSAPAYKHKLSAKYSDLEFRTSWDGSKSVGKLYARVKGV